MDFQFFILSSYCLLDIVLVIFVGLATQKYEDFFYSFVQPTLEYYELSIRVAKNTREKEISLFEKAAILTYIQREKGKLVFTDAEQIYKLLTQSKNEDTSLQSSISLAQLEIDKGNHKQAISVLDNLLSNNLKKSRKDIIAGAWQILGFSYGMIEQYDKAIHAYKESFSCYQEVVEIVGMAAIEGLFNAYNNLGYIYTKIGMGEEAIKIFAICVDLSGRYHLSRRYEKSLFEYSYQNILLENYEEASKTLDIHFQFLSNAKVSSDINFIHLYRTYVFAHWYNKKYSEAIYFMGIYKLYEKQNDLPESQIVILEYSEQENSFNHLDLFVHGFLLLILPKNTLMTDFLIWTSKVSDEYPKLEKVLSSFMYFGKE